MPLFLTQVTASLPCKLAGSVLPVTEEMSGSQASEQNSILMRKLRFSLALRANPLGLSISEESSVDA